MDNSERYLIMLPFLPSVMIRYFFSVFVVLGCISKVNPLVVEYCGGSSNDLVEGYNGDDEGDTWSLHRKIIKII